MNYYTYAYLREDGTPYYIGKGSGRRVYSNTGRNIKVPKDKNRILFLKQNLTEEEAFKHEKYMIAILGRKDLGTGILRNLTDGGEGVSGWIMSDEHKRKLSELKVGEKNHFYGKKHSEETKMKLCDSHKGKTLSEEHKRKISESQMGEKNHNYGKMHSIKSIEKIKKCRLENNPSRRSIPIILIHPNGVEEYFNSTIQACNKYNLQNSKICMVLKCKRIHHKNFKAKYFIN